MPEGEVKAIIVNRAEVMKMADAAVKAAGGDPEAAMATIAASIGLLISLAPNDPARERLAAVASGSINYAQDLNWTESDPSPCDCPRCAAARATSH